MYEFEFRIPPITTGQRGQGQALGVPPSLADRAPAYSDALEEQMGLRLEKGRVPFDTLVIDQVDMPTPN